MSEGIVPIDEQVFRSKVLDFVGDSSRRFSDYDKILHNLDKRTMAIELADYPGMINKLFKLLENQQEQIDDHEVRLRDLESDRKVKRKTDSWIKEKLHPLGKLSIGAIGAAIALFTQYIFSKLGLI